MLCRAMTRIQLLLFFLVLYLSASAGVCGPTVWDKFLSNPTSANYAALKSALLSATQRCSVDTYATYNSYDLAERLSKYIQDGNTLSFRAGLLIYSCFDGAAFEDFCISTGVYFTKYPNDFLSRVNKERVDDADLQYMITMLPEAFVDNFPAQVKEFDRRIALLEANHNPQLIGTKKTLLRFLKKARAKSGGDDQK